MSKTLTPRANAAAGIIAATTQPVVFVMADDLVNFADRLPEGVALFGVTDSGSSQITLRSVSGEAFALRVAPMLCLGFLATNAAALPLLQAARQSFENWAAQAFPEPVLLAKPDDRLGVLLSTALVTRMRDMAASATRLSRELSRLRAAHEDLHNAFSAVEAFLNASNMQPCNLTFENPVVPDAILAAEPDIGGVSQLIPASSFGLSVLQLYLAEPALTAESGCHIELRTLEDDAVHGQWPLTARQLQPGWITLSLPTALFGLQRTPKLIIRPTAAGDRLPPFQLGAPQPLAAYRVTPLANDAAPVADRSLALRCWAGLPGVKPPVLGRVQDLLVPADDVAAAIVREIPLPFPLLQNVQMASKGWQPWFNPLEFIAELRGLNCHPPPSGFIVGRIQGFHTVEASRITVQTVIRHPDAAPIEFALAFTSRSDDEAVALIGAGEKISANGDFYFSGWQRVAYPDTTLLSLDIASALPGHADILVATRMADQKENDFGWATFHDFRLTLLGDAVDFAAPASSGSVSDTNGSAFDTDQLADIRPVGEAAADPGLVAFSAELGGIFCHPPIGAAATVGCLPQPLEADVTRLRARPHLANDRAAAVEFCLVLSDRPAEEVDAYLQRRDKRGRAAPGMASSGWVAAGYADDAVLEVARPRGRGMVRAYFATRMADAGANDYAWCYFIDIRTTGRNPDARDHAA